MAVSNRLCLIGIFLQLTITLQSPQASQTPERQGSVSNSDPSKGAGTSNLEAGGVTGTGTMSTVDENDGVSTLSTEFPTCKNDEGNYCDENGKKVDISTILHPTSGSATLIPIKDGIIKFESAEAPEALPQENSETALLSSRAEIYAFLSSNATIYKEKEVGTYVKVGDEQEKSLTSADLMTIVKDAIIKNLQFEKRLDQLFKRTEADKDIKHELSEKQEADISKDFRLILGGFIKFKISRDAEK